MFCTTKPCKMENSKKFYKKYADMSYTGGALVKVN